MEVKKTDLIFFKNEVLEDIKKFENRINNKMALNFKSLLEKINLNKDNISNNNKKIFEMLKIVYDEEDKIRINNTLNTFKSKIDEFVLLNDTKLSSLEKEFNDLNVKYDKIFISNLTCPGFIGKNCEFSNARSFFDYTRKKLKELSGARDIQNKDIKMYKEKLEILINQFKLQINLTEAKFSLLINESIKKFELRNKEKFKELEDKIFNIRAENEQFSLGLKKKTEELDVQWDKMHEFKDEILNKLEKTLSDLNNERNDMKKENDTFQGEFKSIKKKFNYINDMVKYIDNKLNLYLIENIDISNNNDINRYQLIDDNHINFGISYKQNSHLNEDLSHIRYNSNENINVNNNIKNSGEDNKNINNNMKIIEEGDENIIKKGQITTSNNNDEKERTMNNTDNNKNDINLNHKIDETHIKNKISNIKDFNNNINSNKNTNSVDINDKNNRIGNIIKEMNTIRNKQIDEVNLKKINKINYKPNNNNINNNININSKISSMKNLFNFPKKELLMKEMNQILKKRNLGNRRRDLSYNLINTNFGKREESGKMNRTFNYNFIIGRRNSRNNLSVPRISVVNESNTKSKFYDHKNNKKNSVIVEDEISYNSDYIESSKIPNIGIPDLGLVSFNKYLGKNNQKKNILDSNKIKHMRNKRNKFNQNLLLDNYNVDKETNVNNQIDVNYINDSNDMDLTENGQFLNKEEFYLELNDTKQNINELYSKLNKKIHKLSNQIKNLASEIFKYTFNQKLTNKLSYYDIKCESDRNKTQKTGKEITALINDIKGRKFNHKFFSEINENFSFTEEQKINTKELLKKIDSFLIKKFKES